MIFDGVYYVGHTKIAEFNVIFIDNFSQLTFLIKMNFLPIFVFTDRHHGEFIIIITIGPMSAVIGYA